MAKSKLEKQWEDFYNRIDVLFHRYEMAGLCGLKGVDISHLSEQLYELEVSLTELETLLEEYGK